MRLVFFGFLVLAIAKVMAQSEECINEFEKYGKCITAIQPDQKLTSEEALDSYCQNFSNAQCKDFVAEVNNSDIACNPDKDPKNSQLASAILTIKYHYLTFCVKDNNGKRCPTISQLLGNATNDTNVIKNTYIEDCKINECNDRLVSIVEVNRIINKISGVDDTSDSEYEKFFDIYKNKKCDDINSLNEDSSSGFENVKKFSYVFGALVVLIALAAI